MSDNQIPWIKWEFANWLGGKISRRPAIEQAVFVNMQALMMREGGPIKMDDSDRLDMADRIHATLDEVDTALGNLADRSIIVRDGDTVSIKFLSGQFETVNKTRAKRAEAGARGGKAKASKCLPNPSNCLASATENLASATKSVANATVGEAKPSREGEGVREGEEKENTLTNKNTKEGVCFAIESNIIQLAGGIPTRIPDSFRAFEAEWKRVCGSAYWTTKRTMEAWNDAINSGADPADMMQIEFSAQIENAEAAQYAGSSHNFISNACWLDQIAEADRWKPEPTTPKEWLT